MARRAWCEGRTFSASFSSELLRLAVLGAVTGVVGACASQPTPAQVAPGVSAAPGPPPEEEPRPANRASDAVPMDGVVILAEPDPLTQLSTYDAEELFHLAREMTRTERIAEAMVVYQRLLDTFAHSAWSAPARYNLGLLYEKGGDFGVAAGLYRAIIDGPLPPGHDDRQTWLDAHFRLAVCYGRDGRWPKALEVFEGLLEVEFLEGDDRLEAMVGRGIALQEAGDPASAEVAYSAALRFAETAERDVPLVNKGPLAEAAFRMGVIAEDRYREIALQFPVEVLRARLEQKCAELLRAQQRFTRAIRFGDAHTVAAAGFKIGNLYESLYDEILALEAPDSLTEDQREVYFEEVRDRIKVLVEKALRVYEKALLVGRSAPTAEDWNGRLRAAIRRLETIYLGSPVSNDVSPVKQRG